MKKLTLLLIAVLFVSCATYYKAPRKNKVENIKVIYKPYDDIWRETVKWFAFKNIPIKNLVKNSGLISTELMFFNYKNYVDCGKPGTLQNIVLDVGNFNVVIEKLGSKNTQVTISLFFKADLTTTNIMDRRYDTHKTINCYSKGVLEKELFNFISK